MLSHTTYHTRESISNAQFHSVSAYTVREFACGPVNTVCMSAILPSFIFMSIEGSFTPENITQFH